MYAVYVLKSLKDGKLYTGYTADLKSRLKYYDDGKVEATKYRRPFKLIYCEAYLHQQDATAREKFLKTQWGRNYIKRTLKNYWKEMGT
ncbi:MAG: GIY-YIG nuclease family protein [Candidatus Daviesbacteria bacterium]|nr:GIY-YIG nuclease family protein [Candidatus Daviesbacteria bacterium]